MFRAVIHRFLPFALSFTLVLTALSSCGKAKMSCESESGRAAIVKAVDNALNSQDCATAIATIEPFYGKTGCDTDEIRYARGSAYACAANVNFFKLIGDLGDSTISGTGLWETITRLFPSTSGDSKVTAAEYALDSLFAIRKPGTITPAQYLINTDTVHPGSLVVAHRKDDSNLFGIFTAMSLMGAIQNRAGAPDGSYQKTQIMGSSPGKPNGWMVAADVNEDACAYAGATLTFLDNIGSVGSLLGSTLGGGLGSDLSAIGTTFSALMDTACAAGCDGSNGVSGCNTSCTSCPITLRHRSSCVGGATPNQDACAAAGILHFINTNAAGWQG